MLPVFVNWFSIVASIVISASAQQSTSTSLPQPLQNVVPECASSCFSNFVTTEYPSSICSALGDLNCLCSQYGTNGFTLGEGAFGCIYTSCPEGERPKAATAFGICNGRAQAVSPTHSTLTLVASTISQSPTPSTTIATATASATITTKPTSSSTTQQNGSNQSSTSSGSVPTSAESNTGPQKSILTKSQIVGISVACAALFVLGSAVAACLWFTKRRRNRKTYEDAKSTDDDSPRSFANNGTPMPVYINLKDPRRGAGGVGVAPIPTVQAKSSTGERAWPKYYPVRPEDVGFKPEEDILPPPATKTTVATTTVAATPKAKAPGQNMPNAQASPSRLGTEPGPTIVAGSSLARPLSNVTEFEEDNPKTPTWRPASGYSSHYSTTPHQSLRNPKQSSPQVPLPLKIQIPGQPPTYRPQKPGTVITQAQAIPRQNPSPPNSQPLVGRPPPPKFAIQPIPQPKASKSSMKTQSDKSTTATARSQSSTPARGAPRRNRYSNGSDTSFDSTASDDQTPPEEAERQLKVNPDSPISGLTYPRVPRGSNQRSSRMPPSPKEQSPVSATLASKRRGDEAALQLHKNLWITESNFNNGGHSSANSRSHSRPMSYPEKPQLQPHKSNASQLATGTTVGRIIDEYQEFPLPPPGYRHASKNESHASKSTENSLGKVISRHSDIPMTPIGMITPTRRGDDMYLSFN